MEARDLEFIADLAPDSCFVIHKQELIHNLETLKSVADQSGIQLLMALKGFACHPTFDWIRPYISGVAASSPHEAELAHRKMGGELHAYAPAYSKNDINVLSQWIDHIVFNSIEQYQRFVPDLKQTHPEMEFGLRLNPEHSEADTELYNPSSENSRLGVKISEWNEHILNDLQGIHVHNLCENDSYALERTMDALQERFHEKLTRIKWINFGGGHLITRKGYDIDHLIRILKRWKERFGHQIYLEPSEAFGWETGVLKATVLDIRSPGQDGVSNVILNVSATAHMPDTLEMPYRPKIYRSEPKGAKTYNYRFGGNSCLAGDVIDEYSFDEPLNVGDSILLMDMAHYTMVKTSFFNGVQMPSIAIYDAESQSIDINKTFGYDDYANKLG